MKSCIRISLLCVPARIFVKYNFLDLISFFTLFCCDGPVGLCKDGKIGVHRVVLCGCKKTEVCHLPAVREMNGDVDVIRGQRNTSLSCLGFVGIA